MNVFAIVEIHNKRFLYNEFYCPEPNWIGVAKTCCAGCDEMFVIGFY